MNKKNLYYYLQKFYRKIKSNIETENYDCYINPPAFSDFDSDCFITIYHKQFKDEPAIVIAVKKRVNENIFETLNIVMDCDLSSEDVICIKINEELKTFNNQELEKYIKYLNIKLKIYHKYYYC